MLTWSERDAQLTGAPAGLPTEEARQARRVEAEEDHEHEENGAGDRKREQPRARAYHKDAVQQLEEEALTAPRSHLSACEQYWDEQYCGAVPYTYCDICSDYPNPCDYHYTSDGYEWIARNVSDAIAGALVGA